MNILAIILPLLFTFNNCSEIDKARVDFHNISSKESLYSFLIDFEHTACYELEPYIASAIMTKAKYAFSPFKKYKYFNQGKEKLEVFIKKRPHNIEARYVRTLLQAEIPEFLNYHDNLKNDTIFIMNNISNSELPLDYQKIIIRNIKKISS